MTTSETGSPALQSPVPDKYLVNLFDDDEGVDDELFYVQDTRNYVGNSMLWYGRDGGYVCDVRKAEVFTRDEARKVCRRDVFRAWPKRYITDRISFEVDMQGCDLDESLFWEPPPPPPELKPDRRNCSKCGRFFSTFVPDDDLCEDCHE